MCGGITVLVTGGSGFLGSALIPKLLAKGSEVVVLARDPNKAKSLLPKEVKIVQGDILEPNCGIEVEIPKIDKLFHLAAIHRLSENNAEEIWETNILGTENVLRFAEAQKVDNIIFCSTAYTFARNTYEKSKMVCESMVKSSIIPQKIIVKPSVILPTQRQPYEGHLLQFVSLAIKVHKHAETVRRYLEGKLRLPVIHPVLRLPGNPAGCLNVITVEDVASYIATVSSPGVHWITHPDPPQLQSLGKWIGEVILLDLEITPKFAATPIEIAFQKLGAPFLPYLWGDSFQSDLKQATTIDKGFVQEMVRAYLLGRLSSKGSKEQ